MQLSPRGPKSVNPCTHVDRLQLPALTAREASHFVHGLTIAVHMAFQNPHQRMCMYKQPENLSISHSLYNNEGVSNLVGHTMFAALYDRVILVSPH